MTMRRVGVREFKVHLSRVLREVEAGAPLLVTDRGRVVAAVSPVGAPASAEAVEDLRLWKLVQAGRILPAANPDDRSWVDWKSEGLPAEDVQAILDEIRGD